MIRMDYTSEQTLIWGLDNLTRALHNEWPLIEVRITLIMQVIMRHLTIQMVSIFLYFPHAYMNCVHTSRISAPMIAEFG